MIVPIINNSTIQNYPPYTKEPLVKTSGSFDILLHIYYITNTVNMQYSEIIDISLPGTKYNYGTIHPINETMELMKNIFSKMGFDIVD